MSSTKKGKLSSPPSFGTSEWYAKVDSPIKHMSSPTAYEGNSVAGGLDFAFGTAIPQAVGGYMYAYNFSGMGSNTGDFLSQLGISSVRNSDRTLGSNFYLPMKDSDGNVMSCGTGSKDGCAGEPANTYIQGYPSVPMGTMPAVVDGIVHLNPGMFLDAMYESVLKKSPTCERVTLPVGSSLNTCLNSTYGKGKKMSLGYQPHVDGPASAQAVNRKCLKVCASSAETDEMDNCRRECNRIWWEETRCVPQTESTSIIRADKCNRESDTSQKGKMGVVNYKIPRGHIKSVYAKGHETKQNSPLEHHTASQQRNRLVGITADGVHKPSSSSSTDKKTSRRGGKKREHFVGTCCPPKKGLGEYYLYTLVGITTVVLFIGLIVLLWWMCYNS